MSREYSKPPLIEAVADFRFAEDQDWDWTVPGLMYESVKSMFPIKKQEYVQGIQLVLKGIGTEQQSQNVSHVQFFSEDGRSLMQIAPHALSIHYLTPYPGWPRYKEFVLMYLDDYKRVSGMSKLSRQGLRFVNKIGLGDEPVQIEDYFTLGPRVPDALPRELRRFFIRLEMPYKEEPEGILRLAFGSHEEDAKNVILDFDFVTIVADRIAVAPNEWLDRVHERIEVAFESAITDKARSQLFEVRK